MQAEYVRLDTSLTGIQTCALPILVMALRATDRQSHPNRSHRVGSIDKLLEAGLPPVDARLAIRQCVLQERSEERRVGREYRDGGMACTYIRITVSYVRVWYVYLWK